MSTYVPPAYDSRGFNCPHCGIWAQQYWYHNILAQLGPGQASQMKDYAVSSCSYCSKFSVWYMSELIYPLSTGAPLANSDLPDDVKTDYEEARKILSLSPRGAAALLRLAIQKLCVHLGEKGENLNDDIAHLARTKSIPDKIVKALDVVRVIGNNAIHPGQMDLKDNTQTAGKLFELVNIIGDVTITQPKNVDQLYSSLPQPQKEAIVKRDKPA